MDNASYARSSYVERQLVQISVIAQAAIVAMRVRLAMFTSNKSRLRVRLKS